MFKVLITILTILVLGGCASSPPKNTNDLCAIFAEKKGWYEQARKARTGARSTAKSPSR